MTRPLLNLFSASRSSYDLETEGPKETLDGTTEGAMEGEGEGGKEEDWEATAFLPSLRWNQLMPDEADGVGDVEDIFGPRLRVTERSGSLLGLWLRGLFQFQS